MRKINNIYSFALIKAILFFFVLGCQTLTPSNTAKESDTFDFHSALWVNLHHYLYNEAFSKSYQDSNIPFDSDEKAKVDTAIIFYRSNFKNRDLLFDNGLKKINDDLASAENKENLHGLKLEEGLVKNLEDVKPIYVKYLWQKQNQENLQWISKAKENLKLFESPIKEKLEKVLNQTFSKTPYRIDVVHEANWAGAYTSQSPPHTTISSGRKSYSDYASLEMIFHETLHTGLFDSIIEKIDKEFSSHKLNDTDQLWHAIHFFTAGEITREVLASHGIDYLPYAYENKLFSFDRKWGQYESIIKRYWLPYLHGEISLDESLKSIVDNVVSTKVDYNDYFPNQEACYLVSNLRTGKLVSEYNPQRCQNRFSPYSTFKIPAALMAFEKSILKDENQIIKWDGTKRGRKEENQDQTPLTWMSYSIKWVTEWVMPQLPAKTTQSFLDSFDYGNKDFSGGSKEAWVSSSLQISAYEQMKFLTKFWNEELTISKKSTDLTKKIIFISKLGSNSELYGKTGTGCLVGHECLSKPDKMRGWFVGILKNKTDAYIIVANADDLKEQGPPAGPRLRKSTIQILEKMGLIEK